MSESMAYVDGVAVGVVVDDFPYRISILVFPALCDRKARMRTDHDALGYGGASGSGVGECGHLVDIVAIVCQIIILEIWFGEIGCQQSSSRLANHPVTETRTVVPSAAASERRLLPVERDDTAVGVIVDHDILGIARIVDSDKCVDLDGVAFAGGV